MHTLIATEWVKLRTIRGTWVILGIQQVLVVLGVTALAVGKVDLGHPMGVATSLSHAGVASALLSMIFGITAVAGEYRHHAITDTYLATPARTPVVLAKLTTYGTVGIAFGIISAVTGLATTIFWTVTDNGTLDLAAAGTDRILIGIVAINLVYAVIGVCVGALIRNLTLAVSVALVWILLVETTATNLIGDLDRWLPNRASMALNAMPEEGLLPQWGAAIVLTVYAAVLAVVALTTTVRRDVT